MDHLILLRHAKAEPEAGYAADRDRPLTPRGREAAREAGRRIAGLSAKPTVALVSSARRTRETWEEAAAALPGVEARFVDSLYMASPETIWREASASNSACCLIIGHNPGLHELAYMLVAQSFEQSPAARQIRERFPTAGFAAFEVLGDVLEAAGPRLLAAHLD